MSRSSLCKVPVKVKVMVVCKSVMVKVKLNFNVKVEVRIKGKVKIGSRLGQGLVQDGPKSKERSRIKSRSKSM